jgi:hypothetical protein
MEIVIFCCENSVNSLIDVEEAPFEIDQGKRIAFDIGNKSRYRLVVYFSTSYYGQHQTWTHDRTSEKPTYLIRSLTIFRFAIGQ